MLNKTLIVILAVLQPLSLTCRADLLSLNSFELSNSDGDSLSGVAVGGQGYLGNYQLVGGNENVYPTFRSDSLSFGDKFKSSKGGALELPMGAPVLRATLDHTLAGSVWHSFLFQIDQISADLSSHGGSYMIPSGTDSRLISSAKAQRTGVGPQNAPRPGVGYFELAGNAGGLSEHGLSEPTSESLLPGEVYLLIANFTRVGEPLSAEEPGVARVWVFDTESYNRWRTSGKSEESSLDQYALWVGNHSQAVSPLEQTSSVDPTITLANYMLDKLLIDEVRIGSSLDSVAVTFK